MQINPDNWDDYLAAFRQYFTELNSTDPNRFPTGNQKNCGIKNVKYSFFQICVTAMGSGCCILLAMYMLSLSVIFMERRGMFGLLERFKWI